MIDSFKVTWDNGAECKRICGQIFWMYYDLATSYGRIGHNADFEDIDFRLLLSAEAAPRVENDPSDKPLYKFATMLREGALVALCCRLYNLLCDVQRDAELADFIDECARRPDLKDYPDAEALVAAARLALAHPPAEDWQLTAPGEALAEQMDRIYRKCVVGFYQRMQSEAGTA